MKIKISSGDNKIVTLTTNEGFKINESLTKIDSNSFTIFVPSLGPILTQEIANTLFANGGA